MKKKVWLNLKSTVYTVNNVGVAYKSQNIFALLFHLLFTLTLIIHLLIGCVVYCFHKLTFI